MRLILESITMKNFKSYKGKHHIPNIDKFFTAIVGPNGSGKSNIIDSILFVLGFRAKKMRHTSLTDLIYNDGKKEEMCYVELAFNKFKIRREVYANKSTKYFYNDKEITNNDLTKLMMEENVDMEHNRFLILQGEIESIAMLKPKEGLLEFLEDIIGTTKYKLEIDALTNEAKTMEEENITIQNNMKFIKTEYDHINELKKQNEDNLLNRIKYNEYLKELKNLNIEFIKRFLHKKEEAKKDVITKIDEIKNLNLENKELLKSLETEQNSIRKLLNDKEEMYLEIKKKYKSLERANLVSKELKNKLEKEIKNLRNDYNNLKAKVEMKNKENNILSKELKENILELKGLTDKQNDLKNKLLKEEKIVNEKCKNDLEKMKKTQELLSDLIYKKSEQNQRNVKFNLEVNSLKDRMQELRKEIDELKAKLKNCENVKHLDKLQLEKDLKEIESDIQKTQYELQKRKTRYSEVYKREETIKKEKEILKYFKDVSGVIGRLSDIGKVDPKYELALKTSCTRLNNIVVDTTHTAEMCIDIIKNNNLQRSTFIILDRIQEINKLEELSLPYMFDLVECEPKYKKCFYFSLTDTLLAEDLEKASEYAFGKTRKRVVTLDGKLIEKSGIMTGGKYHEKVKRYEDIEKALEKMTKLRDLKINDLQKICEYENQVNIKSLLKEKEIAYKKIQNKLKEIQSKISEEGYESDINSLKNEISKYKSKIEKFYDSTLRGELQIVNEKIEILEERNHQINILLAEKMESYENIESDLNIKNEKLCEIKIIDLSSLKSHLDNEEKCYNEVLKNFNEIKENLSTLKKKMGAEYHLEIDLNNQLDDLNESIIDLVKNLEDEETHLKNIFEDIFNDNKVINSSYECDNTKTDLSSLTDLDITDFQKKIQKKLKKMDEQNGRPDINLKIFEEYKKIKISYEKVNEQYELQMSKYEDKKNQIDHYCKSRHDEFISGLSKVNLYLKEIYKKLTYGGNAELELVDYLDPFSDGIRLAVMPPKKCWKNVSNLSGGEKTLSSLSLIFALHKFKPSPFYVMDEIDAALDFRNVSIISQYIKEMAKTSQFIVISLRNDMFEISKSILGVYKTNNMSKFLMINVDEIKKKIANK